MSLNFCKRRFSFQNDYNPIIVSFLTLAVGHATKGCYTYPYTHTNENHKGFTYFGLGGSESEMKSAPGPGLIRPKGHNCL